MIVEIEGYKFEEVEIKGCNGCDLWPPPKCWSLPRPKCYAFLREDGKDVQFKQLFDLKMFLKKNIKSQLWISQYFKYCIRTETSVYFRVIETLTSLEMLKNIIQDIDENITNNNLHYIGIFGDKEKFLKDKQKLFPFLEEIK